jgi:ketosteroid isomerase-like protein
MTMTLDDQIREVGQRWARAETTGDIAALAELVTEDFRLVGPYGFVLDRTQWLDRYRSGDLVTTSLSWHDVQVHRYADTVVAIGTQTQHAAYRGTPADGVFRVSHVFVRVRDRWMIAHIQLSLGSPPSTP